MNVWREGSRITDGTQGISDCVSDRQIKLLAAECDDPAWLALADAALKLRAAERKPCSTGTHVVAARCSCPAYEATLEAGA